MKSVALVVAGLVALLAGGATVEAKEGRLIAFVSAEDDDILVAVDLAARRVVRRIPVANGPHNVAANVHHVVVTSPPAGRVTLVDPRSLRVRHVFRGFGYPHDVELHGRYAYVTDEARGQVVVLDLARQSVVSRVEVGAGPHDLAVGDVVTVTHGRRARHLTVLDIRRRAHPRLAMRIRAGGAPHDIVDQPDAANVYVTYWDGRVGAIDVGRRRVLWARRVGALIHHVAFDYFHGRRLWVSDHKAGRVLLLSSPTGRVLRRVRGCPGAHHVAVASSRLALAACHDTGRMLMLLQSGRLLRAIQVGHGLHGIAVAPIP